MTYFCDTCGHALAIHMDNACQFTGCPCRKPCIAITPSELKIFRSLAAGHTVKEITGERSTRTTEAHKSNLMRKLGVHNRQQLTVLALRLGVITLNDIPVPDVAIALPLNV